MFFCKSFICILTLFTLIIYNKLLHYFILLKRGEEECERDTLLSHQNIMDFKYIILNLKKKSMNKLCNISSQSCNRGISFRRSAIFLT